MSTPIKNCPKCRTYAAVGSMLHRDCTNPECTWNTCHACHTDYDRYTGRYTPEITAVWS